MIVPKPIKLCDLSAMEKSDISENDLFLISDTKDENTNHTYVSKKITFSTLQDAMSDGIAEKVTPAITLSVMQAFEPKLDQKISIKISETLSPLDLGGAFE